MLLTFFALLCWTLFGLACQRIAESRGLNPTTWFFVGFFLGLLSLPIAYLWPVKNSLPKPEEKPDPELVRLQKSHWYYLNEEHRQLGPISLDALRRALRDEQLTSKSYIWSDGMEEWKRLNDLPEVTRHIAE